ncbi:MAG: TRAP transporter permease [Hyphomicrobiaceae bacterium]
MTGGESDRNSALAAFSGVERTQSRWASRLLIALALAMVGVHALQLFLFVLPSGQFRNLHLGFSVLIGYLVLIEAAERPLERLLWWVLAALSVVAIVYIHVEYPELVETRSFLPNAADVAVGILLLAVTLILAGKQWGWTIPLLAILGLAYGYWGYLLPGEILAHAGISGNRLIGYSSIPYFQGLLGGLTSLSASTIFMFMLFGGALKATGAIEFIVKLGFVVGRRNRAGPAQVAVISSGLMGTVSGSTVANVASTGAITIPLMKRYGFSPHFAGAVEAVASTGGQIMPPVMGLAAFLIVGITGIPYSDVMIAAIVPAVIYYAFLVVAVHLRSANLGLDARKAADELGVVDLKREALANWHLLAAILLLIYLLTTGLPSGHAALYAVLLLLALDMLVRIVLGGFSLASIKHALWRTGRSFVEGARDGAMVATVIAVIGVMVEILTVTGFAQRLSLAMLELADGRLITLGIIVAMSCLVFGLGLPTSASYFIVALFGAPALIELGVPILAAHMFVFYFANLSAITPPVAVAALVGANIAKANFWKTAFVAVRLALPGFLLPFLFLFQPQILGVKGTFADQMLAAAIAMFGTVILNFALEGRFIGRLQMWERVPLFVAAIALIDPNPMTDLIGGGVAGVLLLRHWFVMRDQPDEAVATPPPSQQT